MYFKKLYIVVLVSMTLLVALGIWVIVNGTAAWNARLRIDAIPYRQEIQSHHLPTFESGEIG